MLSNRNHNLRKQGIYRKAQKKRPEGLLVEYSGLEPLTSTLPVSRSSQMS